MSAEGRDIGQVPRIKDKRGRSRCLKNFRLFCNRYFPEAFRLKWSRDHKRVIKKIETAVLSGGLFALAMPRGSGKTTLCLRAVLWAVLSGHHRYVMLICADEEKAEKALGNLKRELEENPRLLADFPEACFPIQCLQRIANRAKGQLCEGKPTAITWRGNRVVLPTIADSPCSGSVFEVGGITGAAVRGPNHTTPDGEVLRPSLVVIDDPQTRMSASSPLQSRARENIVSADILGMAGPGDQFAALMPCTVIEPDDLADRMLDRKKHPYWHGERMQMLYSWPNRMDLWEKYKQILLDELASDGTGEMATKFYRRRKRKMDAGAVIAWPERKRPDELSGLQHAMNLWIRDPVAFASEYQNEPISPEQDADAEQLTVDDLMQSDRMISLDRFCIPSSSTTLTAFIDVQKKVLYFMVVAWGPGFAGHIVDYGTFPEQGQIYFVLRKIKKTLATIFRGAGEEGAIYQGLIALTTLLVDRSWQRDDGAEMRIDRLLIDAGWQTDIVTRFCREGTSSSAILPSHGKYVGARNIAFSDYRRRPGDRLGHHWRVPAASRSRAIRHVLIDTNYWKTFVHARLKTTVGDRGAISFYRSARGHRMLAEHLTAERFERVEAKGSGRIVDEWKVPVSGADNHLLDCLVGCTVGASMSGIVLEEAGATQSRQPRKPIKLSSVQARKRNRHG